MSGLLSDAIDELHAALNRRLPGTHFITRHWSLVLPATFMTQISDVYDRRY